MKWVVFTSTTEKARMMGPFPEYWNLGQLPIPGGYQGFVSFRSWTAAADYWREQCPPECCHWNWRQKPDTVPVWLL